MGRVSRQYLLDRLLQMPEAADLVANDIATYRTRCITDELRNGDKPKSERIPVPVITERTFERLALLEAIFKDESLKERQSKKASIPRKNFSLEKVFALLDIWAERMLRDGDEPDKRGWKKFVFMNLNLSAWSVVSARLRYFGVSQADLLNRMQDKKRTDRDRIKL